MEVIAEGVEERIQEQTLIKLECTRAQGYLYGAPQYAERIERALRATGKAKAGKGRGKAPKSS